MKRCPICKTIYPNDANFCPMDAGRLDAYDEAPASSPPSPSPSLDLPTMQAKQIGGRFRLGPQLGGRRTGEVYAADDSQTGLSVAVKLIAPAVFPTPLVAQRTERELRQLMKVTSDRIAKIYDVGRQQVASGDRMYVALELVSATPLIEIVSVNGPIGVETAVRLAIEIGEALAEAAKLGVIHRDVSPKNILVLLDERGVPRRVKLINFGIPTPVTDKVLGIPEFLSPEQAEGKPVDQRSNIYSLGALLSYMLTAAPPFVGETDAVLRQQTQTPASPPSLKAPVPILPELDRLVLKALEKSSSRRHLTLRQLLGELEALLPAIQSPNVPVPRVSIPAPPVAPPKPSLAVTPLPPSPPPRAAEPEPGQTMIGMSFTPPSRAPSQSQPPAPPRPQAVIVSEKLQAVVVPEKAQAVVMPEPVIIQPAPAAPAPVPARPTPAAPVTTAPAPPVRPAAASPLKASASASLPRGKASASTRSTGKRGKFRETMWFKKGELDEVAAATAEGEDAKVRHDELPIEDRYKDDGTLSASDAERLTLRTGGTAGMPAVRGVAPGEQMGEQDLVAEMKRGRTLIFVIALGVALIAAAVLIYIAVLHR